MTSQRYVSTDLSHFVGRSLRGDEEAQYRLLIQILARDHQLIAPGHGGSSARVGIPLFPEHEGRYTQALICFCDIPEADLALHMRKYSHFGLAFPKSFLMTHGATPVFYVSTTTRGMGAPPSPDSTGIVQPWTLADHFNGLVAELDQVRGALHDLKLRGEADDLHRAIDRVLGMLLGESCLQFIKGFDPMADDEDEANYYMEREWRIAHHEMRFTLDDVSRIFLPKGFAERFRADVPDYRGQVSFV